MSLPTSLLSYQDCIEVFDKAVEDENGIRIKFKDRDEATVFRMRLHQARKLQREENTKVYEPGTKMYGKSLYDGIKCTLRSLASGHYVYLEHRTIVAEQVESLAEVADEPDVFVPPTEERPSLDVLVTESIKRRA